MTTINLTEQDHFKEAERCIREAKDGTDNAIALIDAVLAVAHAQLANAAANASQAHADGVMASAVDPDGSRLRVAARAL